MKTYLRRFQAYHDLGKYVQAKRATLKEAVDPAFLVYRFPYLRRYGERAAAFRRQLQPYYEAYVANVSTGGMAISLELSTFLMTICNIVQPERILDLGSGFSSVVFRLYMQHATSKPTILSIDDSDEWLGKTRTFLEAHGLSVERMSTWQSFVNVNHGQTCDGAFDLVLHDLGDMEFRRATFGNILKLVRKGGLAVLDDAHYAGYRGFARWELEERRIDYYSLKRFTIDKFGRYSLLVTP